MADRKEWPMLCTDSVVRNILSGAQTQDRRPLKPQPRFNADGGTWWLGKRRWSGLHYASEAHFRKGWPVDFGPRVGDALWVRECWGVQRSSVQRRQVAVAYRAGGDALCSVPDGHRVPPKTDPRPGVTDVWRPSIHMPRWACRTVLTITRVWVERIREISEEDALAEGVSVQSYAHEHGHDPHRGLCVHCGRSRTQHIGTANGCPGLAGNVFSRRTPRGGFSWLWESLYPGSWERNDWVLGVEWSKPEVAQ